MLLICLSILIMWIQDYYCFSPLRAYDIFDDFLAWAGLLYRGAQCMVKIGAGLSQLIPVQHGLLCLSLDIEPLLCRLRGQLSSISLSVSSSLDRSPPQIYIFLDV